MRKRTLNKIVCAAIMSMMLSNTGTAYGYSIDDLREFSGTDRIRTQAFKDYLDGIVSYYKLSLSNYELVDGLSTLKFKVGNSEKYSELHKKQLEIEEEVGDLIGSGAGYESVYASLNRLEDMTNRAEMYKESELSVSLEEFTETYKDSEEAYKAIKGYLVDLASDDFSIGDIGTLNSVVGNTWNISKAYSDNFKGVGFEILKSQETIVASQFYGVVSKVKKNKDSTYKVTIKHGTSLITVINNLNEVFVSNGDTVEQYQTIGKVGCSLNNVDNNGNEIYKTVPEEVTLQIKLDNKYINPMLIYGEDGLCKFYTWLNNNPGSNADVEFTSSIKNSVTENVEVVDNNMEYAIEGDGYSSADRVSTEIGKLYPNNTDGFDYSNVEEYLEQNPDANEDNGTYNSKYDKNSEDYVGE